VQVITLGTGSPIPDPNRAGPSTLVRAAGRAVLVDCGRGVLLRLAAAGVVPPMLDRVVLTHLHSDHVCDFNDVLTTRWVMSPGPNPLRVIGPVGTRRFVDRTLDMLGDDIGYRIAHHADLNEPPTCEVVEVEFDEADAATGTTALVVDEDGFRLLAAPTNHAPVHPTIGVRIEADGAVVALAGDTVPCAGLDALCRDADVYVQTVIRRRLVEAIPAARLQDILDYHSSIEDAAATATRTGVTHLVMTHPVPPPAPGTEAEWEADAAAGFDGPVTLAHDLWSTTVP
jgi:ribonuclease Z